MLDKSYKDLKKKCFTLKIKGFYYDFTMIIFFCKGIKVIFSYFFFSTTCLFFIDNFRATYVTLIYVYFLIGLLWKRKTKRFKTRLESRKVVDMLIYSSFSLDFIFNFASYTITVTLNLLFHFILLQAFFLQY